MKIEHLIRYAPLAIAQALGYPRRSPPARAIPDYLLKDHKPSAIQGEARLRGLERIMYSKTISRLAMTGADHDGGSCCRTGCRKRQPWGGICGFRISLL